jgi:hypothetical protein
MNLLLFMLSVDQKLFCYWNEDDREIRHKPITPIMNSPQQARSTGFFIFKSLDLDTGIAGSIWPELPCVQV